MVYAPAGFGKTTLVTNWALKHQALGTGDWALAMHFFSRAPEFFGLASNPSVAFAHLLAQIFAIKELLEGCSPEQPKGLTALREQWEGKSPDEPKFSIPETQNERASLLCETVANLKLPSGEKLLILLDGIDEADEPFHSPFPNQLPDGVFVIVSARWDGQSEMPYLRGWKFDERTELGLMDESEIAEWLKCYGSGELKAMAENAKFVATLKQATDGLPLFLRFVLDELAEKVKLGETVSAFEVPKGFSAYIHEQVQRIAASPWDGIPLMDLVALLSVAKGAIRQDEIAQVLNMPHEALSHLPNIVARWLRISRVLLDVASPFAGDGGPKRPSGTSPDATEGLLSFAFAHPLLASEFAKAMGEKAKEVEARLIAWCENWREHKSDYALRYLDEHLKGVGEFEKLWALAMDDEWSKIHSEVFTDEPELPLKAVRNGLEAAIEREDAVMMARMLLRHVDLLSRSESPMEALRRGKTERALRLAALLMEQDASMETLWHLILAWMWHQRGEIENAKRALKQLLKTWREESLSRQHSTLRFYLLEPLHDLPEALEAARLVLSDNDKGNLALKLAEERKWKQALDLAKEIENSTVQVKALSSTAAEMAKAERVEEATHLFAEAKQKAMREQEGWALSYSLTELLKALWEAGWEQEAERVVNEAIKMAQRKSAETSVEVLTELAKLLAERGKWAQAENCLQLAKKKVGKIENAHQRCETMGEMTQVWMLMGRKQEAEEAIEQMVSEFVRICSFCCAKCLCAIADEATKVGWKDWAKLLALKTVEIAENIADETERGWAFGKIAKVLTKAGSLDSAKSLAAERKDSWERSMIWEGIAKGLIELGRYKEAAEIADRIENLWHRASTLIASAKAAAMKGDKETAKQIFERAKLAQKELLELEVAVAQAEVGLMEEALVTVEEALAFWQKEQQSARWTALGTIVETLAKQGQVENAELVAQAIKNAWEKAQALKELAFAYMSLGQKEKAEVILRQTVGLAEAMLGDACPYDRKEFFEAIFSQALKMGWHETIDIVLSEFASVHPRLLDEFKEIAARVLAEEGQVGKAYEIAQSIVNPENRAWALIAVAKAFAKAGEKEQARQVIEEAWLLSKQERESAACIRCEVVKLLAEWGEWKTAMQRLESVRGYWYDWQDAVKFLAKEAARQGNYALATQIADKSRQTDFRAEVWTNLVEVFAQAGNEAEARKAFEKAKKLAMESDERTEALTYFASVVAKLGWIEEARGLLEAIEDDGGRRIGIERIVSSLVLCNNLELAEIFAAESDRASVWAWAGRAWAKIGQMEKAKSAFERAMSLAKGDELEEIGETMVEVGFANEGVNLLEGRRLSKWTLWNALTNLAEQGDRRNFLKLLPQCRWDAELAYQACGWLAKLYPERAMEIARIVGEV